MTIVIAESTGCHAGRRAEQTSRWNATPTSNGRSQRIAAADGFLTPAKSWARFYAEMVDL